MCWEDHWYCWRVLPFGLNASPYYSCKCVWALVEYLRPLNVRVSAYVDEFMLMASDNIFATHKELLLECFKDLGWQINLEKSSLVPTKIRNYLGYTINTSGGDGLP